MGNKYKKIFVTGSAGFIGFHLSKFLLDQDFQIVGIDNLNDYYEPQLKKDRLSILKRYNNFQFHKLNIKDRKAVYDVFENYKPDYVVNLAAQAGVRYSIENPYAYVDSNLVGFMNILEACRKFPIKHLIYASSSSVYGGNKEVPFSTDHNVDHPVSLYAATKKSNELLAHSYSDLYDIPTTGLRFFTVYGPWGRPDMAYFLFTDLILNDKPIKVFNHGDMERDFTYIDDIVKGIHKLLDKPPKKNENWSKENDGISESHAPYKIYNIGNNSPVNLEEFINVIEDKVGKTAEKKYMDMQPGDVKTTYADVSDLIHDIDFKPETSIDEGIEKFVKWYREYYNK